MPVATIAIMIATPRGVRQLASPVERDAAACAETILRALGDEARAASFWVSCAEAGVSARLTRYLQEVRAEVMAESDLRV